MRTKAIGVGLVVAATLWALASVVRMSHLLALTSSKGRDRPMQPLLHEEVDLVAPGDLGDRESGEGGVVPVERFVHAHTSFPIVMTCHTRSRELEVTAESLLAVRGVRHSDVLVVQDGADEAVSDAVTRLGLQLVQRTKSELRKSERKDPGFRIAQHYRFALEKAFEHFPHAPGIVVVEDDFLFSPDFMEFMLAVAPAVEHDPSLWIASAWNDNGQVGTVADKAAVRRTSYFPGLGWLLLRSVWEEIGPRWPRGHWDWYMRDPATSKGRDVVYPEVPRTFHAGSKGSFMDPATHEKYFAHLAFNRDATFRWPRAAAESATESAYDARIAEEIRMGVHVANGRELRGPPGPQGRAKVVWFVHDPYPSNEGKLKPLAAELKIWHQLMRGSREGLHELLYQGQRLLLINLFDPGSVRRKKSSWFHTYPHQTKWKALKPENARVFDAASLQREIMSVPLPSPPPTQSAALGLGAGPLPADSEQLVAFPRTHTTFPVLMLAGSADLSKASASLRSLLAVEGLRAENVLFISDAADARLADLAAKAGVQQARWTAGFGQPSHEAHYSDDAALARFAFDKALEHFPDAPAVVVVDSDFEFSNDLMAFFLGSASALAADASLLTTAATNDVGLRRSTQGASELWRSSTFPGGAWLLSRALWRSLKPTWPASGKWLPHLQSPKVAQGKDTLHPAVPRARRIGQPEYALHDGGDFVWDPAAFAVAQLELFEAATAKRLRRAAPVLEGGQLRREPAAGAGARVVWYTASPSRPPLSDAEEFAEEFGLLPDLKLGSSHGVMHRVWYAGAPLFLVNVADGAQASWCAAEPCGFVGGAPSWAKFMPDGARVFALRELLNEVRAVPLPASIQEAAEAEKAHIEETREAAEAAARAAAAQKAAEDREARAKAERERIAQEEAYARAKAAADAAAAAETTPRLRGAAEQAPPPAVSVPAGASPPSSKHDAEGPEVPEVPEAPEAPEALGPVARYLQTHDQFPVVLLCYNRDELLAKTLEELLKVRGVSKENVLVVQDGALEAVTAVVHRFGTQLIQRPETVLPPAQRKDPGFRIAQHYKYALSRAMDHFPDAPGIVIVEDDLRFSPDFMEFFRTVGPAVERDPTLWIASAWNDNGYIESVRDKSAILRTEFFPGLGWLLLRSVWDEIKGRWPQGHWDWFMRDPKTSNGRDVVYPEVPRDYHAGSKGSFMDMKTHMEYFDRIGYNTDASFRWDPSATESAMQPAYDARIAALLRNGVHISHGSEVPPSPGDDPDRAKVIWYELDPHPKYEKRIKPLSKKLHIWHQVMRGAREGMHELRFQGQKVLFINTFVPRPCRTSSCKSTWFKGYKAQTKWITFKPEGARVFTPEELNQELPG